MTYKTKEEYNEYYRRWYQKNQDKEVQRQRKRRQKIKQWFLEYKKTLKCLKCTENHPACLDFHHTDPKEKNKIISYLAAMAYSKKTILSEIEKCVVLCANCHRKEHYRN